MIPPEQIDFANGAMAIFNPVMEQFGFKLVKRETTQYSTTIIWLKGKQYVDLSSNTHPHDAPHFYSIVLGEGNTEHYQYSDLDCVGLWRLKAIHDDLDTIKDTPFPIGKDIAPSLMQTRNDLLTYAKSFLEGDLTAFYVARNKQVSE